MVKKAYPRWRDTACRLPQVHTNNGPSFLTIRVQGRKYLNLLRPQHHLFVRWSTCQPIMSLEMCFTKQKIGIALADRTADPTQIELKIASFGYALPTITYFNIICHWQQGPLVNIMDTRMWLNCSLMLQLVQIIARKMTLEKLLYIMLQGMVTMTSSNF